jgi:hypothetical protein
MTTTIPSDPRSAPAAAAERLRALRRRAAVRAWRATALRDPAFRLSRRSAPSVARFRVLDERRRRPAFRRSRLARSRTSDEALPRFGAPSFTPERRAFERPIAIACFADRAPCLPSRTW